MIKLSSDILAKHVELGDDSPLKGLKITEWKANTVTADTENKKAAKLRKDAETATQNCDNAIGEPTDKFGVDFNVKAARDILAGLNRGNEQKLGDWGFEVDSSARPGSDKPATPA